MFGGIARRYDILNRLLSLRSDVRWRRQAARELPPEPTARILDLCGGTGDLAAEVARSGRGSLVVCCDFCHPMLLQARPKFRRRGLEDLCPVLEADGLRLPLAARSFDAVTVAFGVRNFADMDAAFRQILRVLRPGGRMVVLEFSQPGSTWTGRMYRFYLRRILPALGDRISGRSGPYGYLARTISEFPDPATLAGRIREAGFAGVAWRTLSGGIVAIHTAMKGTGSQ